MTSKKRNTFAEEYGPYVMLHSSVTNSPEYIALSFSAKCILVELLTSMTGDNNGLLTFSKSRAKERKLSDGTRRKGLKALCDAGIIMRTLDEVEETNQPQCYAIWWRKFTKFNGYMHRFIELKKEKFEKWKAEKEAYFLQFK